MIGIRGKCSWHYCCDREERVKGRVFKEELFEGIVVRIVVAGIGREILFLSSLSLPWPSRNRFYFANNSIALRYRSS